jgi:hypothetical protein
MENMLYQWASVGKGDIHMADADTTTETQVTALSEQFESFHTQIEDNSWLKFLTTSL